MATFAEMVLIELDFEGCEWFRWASVISGVWLCLFQFEKEIAIWELRRTKLSLFNWMTLTTSSLATDQLC